MPCCAASESIESVVACTTFFKHRNLGQVVACGKQASVVAVGAVPVELQRKEGTAGFLLMNNAW